MAGYGGFGDIFSDTATGLDGDTIINFGGSDVIDVTDLLPAATKPLAYVVHGGGGTLSVTDGVRGAIDRLCRQLQRQEFHFARDRRSRWYPDRLHRGLTDRRRA